MRRVLLLSFLLCVAVASASFLDDEDEELASLRDSIIGAATAAEKAELSSLENAWANGKTSVPTTAPQSKAAASPAAVVTPKPAAPAAEEAYEPLPCPRGYVRNAKGKCVDAGDKKFQEKTAPTCGKNMVTIDGGCHCRRGFHFIGNNSCKRNHPMARFCKRGFYYFRGVCVKKCPAPYGGDKESRHCIIADRVETQPPRCGRNMILIEGECACKKGFKRARGGGFCIRYRKVFTACRKGFYLYNKKCVRKCPGVLVGEKKSRKCMTLEDLAALKRAMLSAADAAERDAALARERERALRRAREEALAKQDRNANAKALAADAALKRARAQVQTLEAQIASIKARHWTKSKELASAVARAKTLSKQIVDWKIRLAAAKRESVRVAKTIKKLRFLHKRLTGIEKRKARALEKAKKRADELAKALAKDKARAIAKAKKIADLKAKALLEAMRRARAAARAKARELARKRSLDLAKAKAQADALAKAEALARKRAAELARQHADALRKAAELAAKRVQALKLAKAQSDALKKRQVDALKKCQDKAAQRKEALAAARKLAAARLAEKDAKLKALARERDLARARATAAAKAKDAAKANSEYLKQLKDAQAKCHPSGCPKLGQGSKVLKKLEKKAKKSEKKDEKALKKDIKKQTPKKVAPVKKAAPARKARKVLVKCRRGHVRKGLFCVPLAAAAAF